MGEAVEVSGGAELPYLVVQEIGTESEWVSILDEGLAGAEEELEGLLKLLG